MSNSYLSELKDVYGDSIDKILQGNTGNIIYIKSTDDSMLEILEGLSGKMHRIERDSRSRERDMYKVINRFGSKLTDNHTVKEVPVISKNDMLRVNQGNTMVFGKGNPIWNANQCAMPYAYEAVDGNPLMDFDDPQVYTLKTVPTTANTMDFDILNNQPNFINMVNKRLMQARLTEQKTNLYRNNHKVNGHTLTDDDMSRIDPEALAKELMRSVNEQIAFNDQVGEQASGETPDFTDDDFMTSASIKAQQEASIEDNPDVAKYQKEQDQKADSINDLIYAEGQISRHDLLYDPSDDMKDCIGGAYVQLKDVFAADDNFDVDANGSLYMNKVLMIKGTQDYLDDAKADFGEGAGDDLSSLMADNGTDDGSKVEVQKAWFDYLANLPNWQGLVGGQYDQLVAKIYREQ